MGLATGIAFFASYGALVGNYQSRNNYEHRFGLLGILGLTLLTIFGVFSFVKKERSLWETGLPKYH